MIFRKPQALKRLRCVKNSHMSRDQRRTRKQRKRTHWKTRKMRGRYRHTEETEDEQKFKMNGKKGCHKHREGMQTQSCAAIMQRMSTRLGIWKNKKTERTYYAREERSEVDTGSWHRTPQLGLEQRRNGNKHALRITKERIEKACKHIQTRFQESALSAHKIR